MSSAYTLNTEVSTDANRADEKSHPVNEICKRTKWLVDSGATCHCTYDKSVFASYIPLESKEKMAVHIANGEPVKVVGIGDVCFRTSQGVNLVLKDVLHIPGLDESLISVPAMNKQGYTNLFHRGTYTLTRDSLTAVKVEEVRKKYFIEGTIVSDDEDPLSELWHKRLGHLNSCGLENLVQKKLLSGLQNLTTDQCLYCPSALPVKQSCGKSDFLKFVHIAFDGPFHKPSLSGAVYFMTFVDDYSGKAWCYALKEKSEVANAFEKFRSSSEGQTKKSVECVFDDHEHGFSSALQEYCQKNGIHYFSVLPRALSEDNLAETTSYNISNRIDYILANAKLPRLYWEFALDATVHVLNLCPATGLNNDVPDRIWFGKDASYDHLRVFGCRVVVRVANGMTRECLFVGYADDGVNYKFFDPVKMELIFSTDAEFFEDQSIMDIEGGKKVQQDAMNRTTNTTTAMTSGSAGSNTTKRGVFEYLRKFFRRKLIHPVQKGM